jgi:hypothetical protein
MHYCITEGDIDMFIIKWPDKWRIPTITWKVPEITDRNPGRRKVKADRNPEGAENDQQIAETR